MRSTRLCFAAISLAVLAACSSPSTNGPGSDAAELPVTSEPVPVEKTVDLVDAGGSVLGQVTFRQSVTDTGTEIEVQASGLSQGLHPIALYDVADCTGSDEDFPAVGNELTDVTLAGVSVEANGLGETTAQVGPDLEEFLDDDGTALVIAPAEDAPDAGPTGSARACAAVGA